ncbi:hypothetical protein NUW58_g9496 [Xylaria curta]|uniref:Uncharacterized protein n=1 Tax=Xylaria curta TaxID=42375 RepID=A0ACC1MWE6_9PEZI|nr:hypothetical protein NUW58_g9496 [Xylaria curta]
MKCILLGRAGDPLVPPPVDDAARMKEFMFRFDLDIGRTPPHKIRLLKVLRSSICLGPLGPLDLDKAKYELFEFDYEYGKRPSYVAISYVWGDESETSTISINGADVQVRTNLVQALASIRAFNHETYIWVDSVCINQEDKAEKAYMVAYMAPIFACASFVYAFLGPTEKATPHSSSDDLFRHLKELGELFWAHARDAERGKLTRRSLGLGSVLERSLDTLFKKFRLPPGHQDAFPTEEYWALSTRPFWSRIWVIQETCAARRFCLEAFQHHVIRTQGATLRRSSPLEPGDPNEQLRKFALAYPRLRKCIRHSSMPRSSLDITSLRLAMTNFYIKELPRGFRATDPREYGVCLVGLYRQGGEGLRQSRLHEECPGGLHGYYALYDLTRVHRYSGVGATRDEESNSAPELGA